jgi:hypothetical protein
MKPKKKTEPSLRDQLSEPLRDFVDDIRTHGPDALKKVREKDPTKYLELATKILPLVAALDPGISDFSDCQTPADIGRQLLKNVGADEYLISDGMIAEAVEAHDLLIAKLEQIRAKAEGDIQ